MFRDAVRAGNVTGRIIRCGHGRAFRAAAAFRSPRTFAHDCFARVFCSHHAQLPAQAVTQRIDGMKAGEYSFSRRSCSSRAGFVVSRPPGLTIIQQKGIAMVSWSNAAFPLACLAFFPIYCDAQQKLPAPTPTQTAVAASPDTTNFPPKMQSFPLYGDAAIPNSKPGPDEETSANGSWIKGVSRPVMQVYLPAKAKATGAGIVIFPGGGSHVRIRRHSTSQLLRRSRHCCVGSQVPPPE